jgi:hypothetical protein
MFMCWTKRSSVKNLIYSGQLLYSYAGFISRTSTNKPSGKRISLFFQECHKKFYVECLEWWSGPCWLQKPLRPTISLWWIVSKIGLQLFDFGANFFNLAPNFEFRAKFVPESENFRSFFKNWLSTKIVAKNLQLGVNVIKLLFAMTRLNKLECFLYYSFFSDWFNVWEKGQGPNLTSGNLKVS